MTKINLDFPDKWFGHSLCFFCPVCQNCAVKGIARIFFPGFAARLKNVGYQMKGLQSRCVLKQMLALFFFFFFAGMQRLEKTLFLCTYWRWGNENNMEWMQGLRAPCPACADESQRPDLIHTPGSNEQKRMHSCRKALVHAQSPQETASVAQTIGGWYGAWCDTGFCLILNWAVTSNGMNWAHLL